MTSSSVRHLNDRARQSLQGCRVLLTAAVMAHPRRREIIERVRRYDRFAPANDPYEEHDFGSFTMDEHVVFWKWDYMDSDLLQGSPDPSDPSVTTRVLTIMFAEDY